MRRDSGWGAQTSHGHHQRGCGKRTAGWETACPAAPHPQLGGEVHQGEEGSPSTRRPRIPAPSSLVGKTGTRSQPCWESTGNCPYLRVSGGVRLLGNLSFWGAPAPLARRFKPQNLRSKDVTPQAPKLRSELQPQRPRCARVIAHFECWFLPQ